MRIMRAFIVSQRRDQRLRSIGFRDMRCDHWSGFETMRAYFKKTSGAQFAI